jgi:hypothetical protein
MTATGECVVTSLHDHRGACERVRIDRADPRILVAAQLLEDWRTYGTGPFADLRPGPGAAVFPGLHGFGGWLITIRGENRTVVYRIGRKVPTALAYEAEWPD